MRVATNQSNLNIIDNAKNLGQGPIAPDVNATQIQIMGGLLLIPLVFLLIGELLDNKIRNLKELLTATKIPLLGVIGHNSYDNNLQFWKSQNHQYQKRSGCKSQSPLFV
jgi:capsular polysaccharide biosynthesis protein